MCLIARASSRPFAKARFFEWSVMAMYLYPRSMAAAAISFDGATAVRFHGVHVHIALNVFFRDQFGKLVSSSGFNLSAVFA